MNATTFSSWLVRQFNRGGEFPERAPRDTPSALERCTPGLGGISKRVAAGSETKPNECTTTIFRSIGDIDRSEWDAIVGRDNLLKSHAYLTAIESSEISNCTFYFPVVRNDDGALAAHACVYVIDTDLSQLLPKRIRWMTPFVRKFWRRFLVARITECAAPLSTSHSISLHPAFDRRVLIEQIAGAVDSIAKAESSRLIVIRDFREQERSGFDAFCDNDYNVVSNMPLARIRVRWDSYSDYLAAMRARYRKDVKRRLRRARACGQTVRRLEAFSDDASLWACQARTVQEKTKGFKREVLPPEYYQNIDRQLGDRSLLVVAERNGRPIAHGMLLKDDFTTIATYFGRDRGPAQQEWFQLVNEVIRIGIENKSRYINLGLGSYDAKLNVGADIEPLFVYSKSTLSAVNWLMRRIPKTMERAIASSKQIFRDEAGEMLPSETARQALSN